MLVTVRALEEWAVEFDGSTAPRELYGVLILGLKQLPRPRSGSRSRTVARDGATAQVVSTRSGECYDVQMEIAWQGLRWQWTGRLNGNAILDYRSPRYLGRSN